MMLLSGITICEESTGKVISLVHQTGIPLSFIGFKSFKSNHLIPLLDFYERNPNVSVRQLASKYGRSYKKLQKEYRQYFGTTFHSFFLKLRMLDVLNDVMFTGLSLKGIAFKNDFSEYSFRFISYSIGKINSVKMWLIYASYWKYLNPFNVSNSNDHEQFQHSSSIINRFKINFSKKSL